MWGGNLIAQVPPWLDTTYVVAKVVIGFSLIIFVHELGHFLAAKWVGIRVDRFAIGFGPRLFGWRPGEGFTLGGRPAYSLDELQERGWGETDYCFKLLPLGGYVKMLGQDDIQVNDKTGEVKMTDDPRAFNNKPVGRRMIVVSAGVLFNLLFAILVFMGVFMIGKRTMAPQIGVLEADSPAAQAGLRSGDIIVSADGKPVETFRDVVIALILADNGEVNFEARRDGKLLPEPLHIQANKNKDDPLDATGIGPDLTTELMDTTGTTNLYGLQGGDRITKVGGRPVSRAADVLLAFNDLAVEKGLSRVEVTFERPDPAHPGEKTTHTTTMPVIFRLGSAQMPSADSPAPLEPAHVLGLCPRQCVDAVTPGEPGEKAGLRPEDVIVQWGSVLQPCFPEIKASIEANASKPIPVVVLRDGERVELTVTPRRPFQLTGTPTARAGIAFKPEDRPPVVADVVDNTPAASLKIPRGSTLVSVDGKPVKDWLDVIRTLLAAADRTISVTYRTGDVEVTGSLDVPSSVVNELHLPLMSRIVAINNETEVELADGTIADLPKWVAIRAMLAKYPGQTVKVRYQRSVGELKLEEADFHVRKDLSNVNPWQLCVVFGNPDLPFKAHDLIIQTNNPIRAAWLGIEATGDVLAEVYGVLRTLTRSIGGGRSNTVKHVSGPVGIVSAAVQRARVGYAELLYFLAFLSVNLAVINFLPFPVVDGGLMVFLIIEKIKGKPLSIKTQTIATLVGLATIVLVFLLVTIQDITKIFR
jgi:regulator of sigma E protease